MLLGLVWSANPPFVLLPHAFTIMYCNSRFPASVRCVNIGMCQYTLDFS